MSKCANRSTFGRGDNCANQPALSLGQVQQARHYSVVCIETYVFLEFYDTMMRIH